MTKLTIKQPCLNRTTDSSVKSEFKTLQITILYRTEEYKRRREGGRARSACRQTERVKEIQTDRKRRKRDRQTEGGSEGETEAGKTNREEGIGTDGERAERKRQSGGSGTDRKGNGTTDRQRQGGRTDRGRERETDSCLLYTSPSPRDWLESRMPSSA